jgi:glycosyltransferase involved in cell wall biosynthesis
MKLSLVVMAYCQEAFIEGAVASALAQDYPDLEIVLTDDASPDRTFQIMSDMAAAYKGPHRIVLNRNPQNLGLIGHVNRLFDLVTSDWLIYNAGDDLSDPSRASRIAGVIREENPRYIYSGVWELESSGMRVQAKRQQSRPERLLAKSLPDLARVMSHALGASSAWHRDLFRRFGTISETEIFEDQALMFRARLLGDVSYIDDPLLTYRRGIGLSFQSKDDVEKKLRQDLAVLRQRRADTLSVCPDRQDILKSIDRKFRKRSQELEAAVRGDPVDPAGFEEDAG